MRYGIVSALLASAFAPWGIALAQTACPAGVPPGDPRCGPSPEWHQPQQAAPAPQRVITRERIWENRFGAFAQDSRGPLGVADGHKTRASAEAAARQHCVERGGELEQCKILRLYRNQCMTYVWGGGLAITEGGPDIEEIELKSIRRCEAENREGARCRVVYTGCSRAEHVGFRYH